MNARQVQSDVVVCGGGLPGVCAAIAAARNGSSVVLVQDRPVLGGNSSSEAGVPPAGAATSGAYRMARETGIVEELRMEYARRCSHADNRQMWDLVLYDHCRREPNLELYTNTRIFQVEAVDKTILAVVGLQGTTETIISFHAPIFIDATGDGFVASEAGAEFRLGQEGRDEFHEQAAPAEPSKTTMGSSLLFSIYRRDHEVAFVPPAWAKKYPSCSALLYRSHTYEYFALKDALSRDLTSHRMFWWIERGGESDTIRDTSPIYDELLAEMMGVWDHLKNHCEPHTREMMARYDLVWWSTIPLRRESRRVVGDYVMTERDIVMPQAFHDRIAHGGWPIDLHPTAGLRDVTQAPCVQTFQNDLYSIPFRCFYARDLRNLFMVGRCLSASRVAWGSLRLMFTLANAAQAVGTAAHMCVEREATPRDILQNHLEELQQRLLRDDMYIISLKSTDRSDLTRTALVETSSDAALTIGEPDGFLPLRYATAQQLPVSTKRIRSVSVLLESALSAETTARLTIGRSARLGKLPRADAVATFELTVAPGAPRWYPVQIDLDGMQESLLCIALDEASGVSWGFSRCEAFGTRVAVAYDGGCEPHDWHGKAQAVPHDDGWYFVNHHGRLPGELHDWLNGAVGAPDFQKHHLTLCVKVAPDQRPYAGANVVNGYNRAEDWPNLWVSDPTCELPQSLDLLWKQPIQFRRVVLTFDTNLDAPDRFLGVPKGKYGYEFPVPETVRDYRVLIKKGVTWTSILTVEGNTDRRRSHCFGEAIVTEAMRIEVMKTNGSPTARIYEVRVYDAMCRATTDGSSDTERPRRPKRVATQGH